MLEIRDVVKTYDAAGVRTHALRGISISFRKNEFVAVLGQSGSGKTTLLNIIGGLDHYDSGDMRVQGRSTKEYTDRDWDNYRNHRVGFVFQSYYLIPHQTVLGNVELALTLSGVSRTERRRRAEEALDRVGLKDQAFKRPNQLSGGQMQRVAIARALVNDPEILLADEPTGALDSATGLQVMEILKEVARDRLVIMVTHNPDLADAYATRIVRLEDGSVISDSAPFETGAEKEDEKGSGRGEKQPSMGVLTALSLSFRNLMTKKGRTLLTCFAGSIGIIGIALILSISTGVTRYIDRVQQDTLSGYPLEIEESQMDFSGMMLKMMSDRAASGAAEREEGRVYSGDVMSRMLNAMNATVTHNDLKAFRAYIEDEKTGFKALTSGVQYTYGSQLNIWRDAGDQGWIQVNPSQVLSLSGLMGENNGMMGLMSSSAMSATTFANLDVFTQLIDNKELMDQQYQVLTGRMPASWDEAVIIVSSRGQISDYTLYALGLRDQSEIAELTERTLRGEEITVEETSYSYEELMGLTFRLVLDCDRYREGENGIWHDVSGDAAAMAEVYAASPEIRIVGILMPREDAITTQTGASGGIGYLGSLQEKAIALVSESAAVRAQTENSEIDIFTGLPFEGTRAASEGDIVLDRSLIPEQYRIFVQNMTDAEIVEMARKYGSMYGFDFSFTSSSTLEGNLKLLGVLDRDRPEKIRIYPKDFESKEKITALIDTYNEKAGEENAIAYTDYIGLILSGVTTIINAVSYVLIAFVAISLVVSSIMIGVITYISVLERTREIGILRAIGASRRDVGRVFNAETLIIGLVSGILGICATLLLNILVNIVLHNLTGITATAVLPVSSALILILISMVLTFLSGLIPSGSAGRKDPVAALRTE